MLVPGERITRFRKLLPVMIPRARPAFPFPVLFAFVCLAVSGCATNPAPGARQIAPIMSPADEAKAGAAAHPKILKAYGGAYNDEELGAYVAGVTARIVSVTNQPDGPYQVTILDSPVINAFALPGGYVYVTRGLMALANDEAELASVIGHEIGHVAARHSAERYSQQVAAGVGMQAAQVALQSGDVSGAGQIAAILGAGVQFGILLPYSRTHELEADRLGIEYMHKSGFDPRQSLRFWQNMSAQRGNQARALKRDVLVVYLAARDPRTPWALRLLALAVAAYALSPIDLVPDFIPVLGYLDDLLIVPLGLALVLRLLPPPVLLAARERAARMLARPRSWLAAAIIIMLWVLLAVLLFAWWRLPARLRGGHTRTAAGPAHRGPHP